jgi:hypothetical protein
MRLTPAPRPFHPTSPHLSPARPPDTVATPAGDNETPPDQPVPPAPEGLQRIPAIDTNKL